MGSKVKRMAEMRFRLNITVITTYLRSLELAIISVMNGFGFTIVQYCRVPDSTKSRQFVKG